MNKAFREVLTACLKEAGALIVGGIDSAKKVDIKGRFNLVTATDKKAEEIIVKKILSAFPDHAILAEESGRKDTKSRYRWIIDPLDGTTNFAHSFPLVCTTIGLEEDGKIIMGGVFDPTRNELFFAERGKGATLNGKKIAVSAAADLSTSLLCTGFPYDRHEEGKAAYYLGFNEEFLKRCHGVRRTGTAALDLCYVASGRFDGFWEFYLHPWDVAAASLLVEEAGGKITDYYGGAYHLDAKQTLASNGRIHKEMVDILVNYMEKTKGVRAK